MRYLMIVPIVHSSPDMGSMRVELERESIAKIGKERWEENQRKIENLWNEVEAAIDALDLSLAKVRVYQDGMPCGGELGWRIVREVADKGSRNYQIVRRLIERGATLEATEDPKMLLKEYKLIRRIADATTEREKTEAESQYEQMKESLLRNRDEFIAKAISSTLKDGEMGILFIGAAHDVRSKLPEDVQVRGLD
ncbi:MAG: hypothetical protein PHN90_09160 [Methanothrix sp.]|jgi:hypothetical protein|nr:hypothetical protein [Methanothrix sp.]